MRDRGTTDKIKDWARFAASVGVLLSQPRVRARMEGALKDRLGSLADSLGDRYDDVVHRVGGASDALRGRNRRNPWPNRAMSFAVGLGMGAGLGLILAPARGSETRKAIRGTAVNFKDTVMESASSAAGKAARSIA
jgi:hypothetical protein